jgi:hypothetical protein
MHAFIKNFRFPMRSFAVLWLTMATTAAMADDKPSSAPGCSVRSGVHVVPLVELYTSEGCSSCPPADRWLSQRIRGDAANANWLAFHVDYWDELGWPDRFASPTYSERQRRRVGATGGATVYTPQVMIGGDVRVDWRDATDFSRTLQTVRIPAKVGLALAFRRDATGGELRLGAARQPGQSADAWVWLAQSVDGQQTQVRAGENDGVALRHDRVVRKLWGPWRLGDRPLAQRLRIPAEASGADFTAFVQDATGATWQSLRLPADRCR